MSALSELLASRVKAEVFRLLFGVDPLELHVRELARRARLNDATVRQELKRLKRVGIVGARRDGNRTYFRAVLDHPLYPDIRSLVLKTSGLVEVLRQPLTDPRVQVAFVFGSLAADEEKAHSDVDLMVIGRITLRALSQRLAGVETKVGREVNPHILTREEFARRKRSGDHFLTNVMRAPRLFVVGDEHELERLG